MQSSRGRGYDMSGYGQVPDEGPHGSASENADDVGMEEDPAQSEPAMVLREMGDNMYTTWRALLSALPMYAVRDGVRVLDFASTMPENLGRDPSPSYANLLAILRNACRGYRKNIARALNALNRQEDHLFLESVSWLLWLVDTMALQERDGKAGLQVLAYARRREDNKDINFQEIVMNHRFPDRVRWAEAYTLMMRGLMHEAAAVLQEVPGDYPSAFGFPSPSFKESLLGLLTSAPFVPILRNLEREQHDEFVPQGANTQPQVTPGMWEGWQRQARSLMGSLSKTELSQFQGVAWTLKLVSGADTQEVVRSILKFFWKTLEEHMPQVMQPYRDQPTQNGPATEEHVKMWYEANLRLFAALLYDREHRAPNATVADVRVLPGKCWGAAVASMFESGITVDEERQLKKDVLGLETKTFLLHCIVPEDQQANYGDAFQWFYNYADADDVTRIPCGMALFYAIHIVSAAAAVGSAAARAGASKFGHLVATLPEWPAKLVDNKLIPALQAVCFGDARPREAERVVEQPWRLLLSLTLAPTQACTEHGDNRTKVKAWEDLTRYISEHLDVLSLGPSEHRWVECVAIKANRRQAWDAATCRAGYAAWEQAWNTLQAFHADRAAGREATGKREAIDKLKQAVTLLLKSPEGKTLLCVGVEGLVRGYLHTMAQHLDPLPQQPQTQSLQGGIDGWQREAVAAMFQAVAQQHIIEHQQAQQRRDVGLKGRVGSNTLMLLSVECPELALLYTCHRVHKTAIDTVVAQEGGVADSGFEALPYLGLGEEAGGDLQYRDALRELVDTLPPTGTAPRRFHPAIIRAAAALIEFYVRESEHEGNSLVPVPDPVTIPEPPPRAILTPPLEPAQANRLLTCLYEVELSHRRDEFLTYIPRPTPQPSHKGSKATKVDDCWGRRLRMTLTTAMGQALVANRYERAAATTAGPETSGRKTNGQPGHLSLAPVRDIIQSHRLPPAATSCHQCSRLASRHRLGEMECEIFNAIQQGNEGMIATLLTADMTLVEKVDRLGNTPLLAAAYHGGLGVLNLLVQSGSNLSATRCDARTALHVAAMMGHERAVAFLLREGAQGSCRDAQGMTPLMMASTTGPMGMVRSLVRHMGQQGLGLEQSDAKGWTAVHWTAWGNHEEAAAFLLSNGAQATCRDNTGMTPLMLASSQGRVAVVRVLAEHMRQEGTGLEQLDAKGRTAMHIAAERGHEVVVAFLLGSGAQAVSSAHEGMTPLMMASSKGHMGVLRVLAEHMRQEGTGLEQLDAKGRTAMHWAASKGHADVIRLLLTNGAQATCRMSRDLTPLIVASHANQMHAVQVLLCVSGERELGAADTSGATALHWAAKSGCEAIVRLLLLHGADPSIETRRGETPLAAAQRKEQATCVAVFEWWEAELERRHFLSRAARLYRDHTTQRDDPTFKVPAYLEARVSAGHALPSVEVVLPQSHDAREEEAAGGTGKRQDGGDNDEAQGTGVGGDAEIHAVLEFVMKGLNGDLVTELLEGFHTEK